MTDRIFYNLQPHILPNRRILINIKVDFCVHRIKTIQIKKYSLNNGKTIPIGLPYTNRTYHLLNLTIFPYYEKIYKIIISIGGFMAKDNVLHIDESMIDTVLAEDINFQGTMKFSKSLMIKGKFEGQIDASGHLIIGTNAVVTATIKAGVITNYGQINGNVEGTERVELFNNAKLTGDIKTPELIIESGCTFNGNCTMSVEKKPVVAAAQTQSVTQSAPQSQKK